MSIFNWRGGLHILKVQQIIGTRFNFPVFQKGYDNAWHSYRLNLFDKICLPSVLSQRDVTLDWIITLNDQSPLDVTTYFNNLNKKYSWIKPFYLSVEKRNEAVKLMGKTREITLMWENITNPSINDDTDYVITTKLDSDDAINFDYMKNVLSNFREQECCINYPNGIWRQLGSATGTYQSMYYNAFQSVISKVERLNGTLKYRHVNGWGGHKIAHSKLPLIEIPTADPMWAVTIHSKNDSTKMRPGKTVNNLKKYFDFEI